MTQRLLLLALIGSIALGGCQSAPWSMGPFAKRENSTYRTATMRIDAIREFASRSTGVDTPEQREITNQLARQIQVEPDPLVREAIIDTIAEFRTPLAAQVLQAGLQDEDLDVRRRCCKAFGKRRDLAAIPTLARVIETETNLDVRLAAVEALGDINSPDAKDALVKALEDRDPAMQYAGVQALQKISGRDFGGDVSAWLEYARGDVTAPAAGSDVSIARRLRQLSPF